MSSLTAWQLAQSACLERLVGFATRLGYVVTVGPAPDPDAMGHVCYRQRRIWVDPVHPFEALVTLCHELGHALACERMGRGVRSTATPEELEVFATGERRAYLYGWAVVRHVGATRFVDRETWRGFHVDESLEVAS